MGIMFSFLPEKLTQNSGIVGNLKKQKALPEYCHSALFGSSVLGFYVQLQIRHQYLF
jgi:hypothetical protein